MIGWPASSLPAGAMQVGMKERRCCSAVLCQTLFLHFVASPDEGDAGSCCSQMIDLLVIRVCKCCSWTALPLVPRQAIAEEGVVHVWCGDLAALICLGYFLCSADLARLLLPSTPMAEVICDADLVLGPPTLARIAGTTLRNVLVEDLSVLQQAAQMQDAMELAPSASASDSELHMPGIQHNSATPVTPGNGASDTDEDGACGVCFETACMAVLQPCRHQLCLSCCQQMLGLEGCRMMLCPFCRAPVGRLQDH
jgi:hypothetical protein